MILDWNNRAIGRVLFFNEAIRTGQGNCRSILEFSSRLTKYVFEVVYDAILADIANNIADNRYFLHCFFFISFYITEMLLRSPVEHSKLLNIENQVHLLG